MAGTRIQAVFFDIGGTLGLVDPDTGRLAVYEPSTRPLIEAARHALGLRVGIITNIPATWTHERVRAMLSDAGLLDLIDPQGLVTSQDAQAQKPAAAVYQFAAARMGLAPGQCLFVGEDPAEVGGAAAAGMSAVLKPPVP